ncbi:MAG: TIM barrel protein [bacterium]|nr:TIM barrel protein [bacterium]
MMIRPHDRRSFLGALGLAGATAACSTLPTRAPHGRLRQSVAGWCFMNQGPGWDIETLAGNAASLGCEALELIEPEHWDVLRRHGLICCATKSHTFVRGMNNRGHWPECHTALRSAIEVTAAAGFPNVMTFTGFSDTSSEPNGSRVDPEEGIDNCVRGYEQVVGPAERSNVTLILEPLNTRDPAPMKGHPGYLGDHVEECVQIVRRVGSPALKLLFDVYHVQIMDGDLIRRIRELSELIAHVQVAGCPGRGPLGAEQEIHYPAVMRALAETGYDGYVGHEWIATGDALAQLRESVAACTV